MSKLWQSKQENQSETANIVEAFTVGNDYVLDQVLVPFDLRASVVHAKALHKAGILTKQELSQLTEAIDEIQSEWENGHFKITVQNEDMHTAIEKRLTEKIGETGKKIHTARSRNDQVLTAMRLYEKESLENTMNLIRILAGDLINFGIRHENIPMPGYTHTRKAMLSSVGLWAGGFAEMLIIQLEASEGIMKSINRSPLGTAAGFGTSFDIDRMFEAKELGFETPLFCSTTAQLSRGWIELQLVQYLCGVTAVLNRLSTDVIQLSSEESPYFDLDEVICTGSSIMPQKKNPDLAELIRAGHADMIGFAGTLQTIAVNLGSGYHRDLQLTKEPVLKAFDRATDLLNATSIMVGHISPNKEELAKACSGSIFAAEKANALVKEKGFPFREAYRAVKNDDEQRDEVSVSDMMKSYTHIGSPGNTGLNELKKRISN